MYPLGKNLNLSFVDIRRIPVEALENGTSKSTWRYKIFKSP